MHMRSVCSTVIIFTFLWSHLVYPVTNALAQDTCTENLKMAEQNYYEGNFDVSIDLVRSCLTTGNLAQSELLLAYKILAQAYLAKNNPETAGKIIKKILEINPNYSPTIEQEPPPFVELVNQIKKDNFSQQEADEAEDNKWLWIGAGGVAVVGIITIIALSSDEDNGNETKPLAQPPAWPDE